MFTNISSSQFHKVFHKVSQSFWEIYIFNKISFVLGIKGFRVSESRIIITHRRPPSSRDTWPSFLALVPNIALNPLNYRSSIKHVSHCCRPPSTRGDQNTISNPKKRYKRDAGSDPSGSFTIFDSLLLFPPLQPPLPPSFHL